MTTFLMKRTGSAVLVLLTLVFVLFILQQLSPIDPVRTLLGTKATPELIAQTRERLGYDDPIYVQFFHYIVGLLHLDFGTSVRTHGPVGTELAGFVPATLELLGAGIILAIGGGLLLGLLTARGGAWAGVVRVVMLLGASIPAFLLAILMILLFYSKLGWFPATGRSSLVSGPSSPTGFLVLDGILTGRLDVAWDGLLHLVLPALTIAVIPAVAIGRALSSAMQTTMRQEYVRTARVKGLRESTILVKHALRNCMNSALAMTGLQVAVMFASVTVVEVVFAFPGIGNYLASSVAVSDLPAVLGVSIVIGIVFVVVNAIVDIVQGLADPRVGVN